jgi:hypothetical protein
MQMNAALDALLYLTHRGSTLFFVNIFVKLLYLLPSHAGQDAPQVKAAFQCLVTALQAAGYLRGLPSVLSAAELAAYDKALADRCVALLPPLRCMLLQG